MKLVNWVRTLIDPFEFLYMAVAIATFTHTQYAAAYMFEGEMPLDPALQNGWKFQGALWAITIDVGLFLTARYIAKSKTWFSRLVLITTFIIASVASGYMQLAYVLMHTPEYTIAPGVSEDWKNALMPLMQARVVILPAFLPLMGVIYTLARITQHTERETLKRRKREEDAKASENRVSAVIKVEDSSPEEIKLLGDGQIDYENLKFYDAMDERWRGPYRDRDSLERAMRMLASRRKNKALVSKNE